MENFFLENDIKVISPMIYQNITPGILILGKRFDGVEYTKNNLCFIQSFSYTAILALENFRLVKEEIKKRQIEKELTLALEIQQNLFPREIPEIQVIDLYGLSILSWFVGGDYFDMINKENELLLVIADIAGKGIPSALIMLNVQYALKILSKMDISLVEIIQNLHLLVYENTAIEKFVTLFIGNSTSKKLSITLTRVIILQFFLIKIENNYNF